MQLNVQSRPDKRCECDTRYSPIRMSFLSEWHVAPIYSPIASGFGVFLLLGLSVLACTLCVLSFYGLALQGRHHGIQRRMSALCSGAELSFNAYAHTMFTSPPQLAQSKEPSTHVLMCTVRVSGSNSNG